MTRLLSIVLLFFCNISFAQKIYFTDTTNAWHVHTSGGDPFTSGTGTYQFIGDTIINSHSYRILAIPVLDTFYIREDTAIEKVFVITNAYPHTTNDTVEKLLYDYTLQVGDTFKCEFAKHVVTQIDSVAINGIKHKTWHLVPDSAYVYHDSGAWPYDVVEGIGALPQPWFPAFPMLFERRPFLMCFNNDHATPAVSPGILVNYGVYYTFNNTSSCVLGTTNMAQINRLVSVVPNPITAASKILLPFSITSGALLVVNDIGQVVTNYSFQNIEELPIDDQIKTTGLYYYRVTDYISGEVFSGKFVKY